MGEKDQWPFLLNLDLKLLFVLGSASSDALLKKGVNSALDSYRPMNAYMQMSDTHAACMHT